jgi:hypothetical protein
MRDVVFFFVAFVWATVVVGFVSLYVYAGDSIQCGALHDQDACVRLEFQGARASPPSLRIRKAASPQSTLIHDRALESWIRAWGRLE